MGAKKEAAKPNSRRNVSSRECAFNISDVWTADTVYVTAVQTFEGPFEGSSCSAFEPVLIPVFLDWGNVLGHVFILKFNHFHSNAWENLFVFKKYEDKVVSNQVFRLTNCHLVNQVKSAFQMGCVTDDWQLKLSKNTPFPGLSDLKLKKTTTWWPKQISKYIWD